MENSMKKKKKKSNKDNSKKKKPKKKVNTTSDQRVSAGNGLIDVTGLADSTMGTKKRKKKSLGNKSTTLGAEMQETVPPRKKKRKTQPSPSASTVSDTKQQHPPKKPKQKQGFFSVSAAEKSPKKRQRKTIGRPKRDSSNKMTQKAKKRKQPQSTKESPVKPVVCRSGTYLSENQFDRSVQLKLKSFSPSDMSGYALYTNQFYRAVVRMQ